MYSILVWLIVAFFLSLKWITNKKLHLKDIDDKFIVLSRYFIALIMTILYIYFFSNISLTKDFIFQKVNLIIIAIIIFDFISTIFTQYNFKRNWHSTFLNISSILKTILYIPIAILFLNETINSYQAIWIIIIIIWIVFYQKYTSNWNIKEYNFKDLYIWINIFLKILVIFLFAWFIKNWWNYMFMLMIVYFWTMTLYILYFLYDYKFNNEKINLKTDKLLILDWIFFALWSIWTIYLYSITESYQVALILTTTYLMNVILFKLFHKENNFKLKLFFSVIIIIWIILLKLS